MKGDHFSYRDIPVDNCHRRITLSLHKTAQKLPFYLKIGRNKHCTLAPLGLEALSLYLTTTEGPQTKKKLRTESKDNSSNNTASGRNSTREEISDPSLGQPGSCERVGSAVQFIEFLEDTVGELGKFDWKKRQLLSR